MTFVDLLGIDGCEAAVAEHTKRACDAVGENDGEFLCFLAEQLAGRNK